MSKCWLVVIQELTFAIKFRLLSSWIVKYSSRRFLSSLPSIRASRENWTSSNRENAVPTKSLFKHTIHSIRMRHQTLEFTIHPCEPRKISGTWIFQRCDFFVGNRSMIKLPPAPSQTKSSLEFEAIRKFATLLRHSFANDVRNKTRTLNDESSSSLASCFEHSLNAFSCETHRLREREVR